MIVGDDMKPLVNIVSKINTIYIRVSDANLIPTVLNHGKIYLQFSFNMMEIVTILESRFNACTLQKNHRKIYWK